MFQLVLAALLSAGFQCAPRPEGQLCWINRVNGPGFAYSQPVVVAVPASLKSLDVLHLHLHGWRGVCEAADATALQLADGFKLLPQAAQARFDRGVLVMPVSRGRVSTYSTELAPKIDEFNVWIADVLKARSARWSASGHSGAGRILAETLGRSAVFARATNRAALLDAAYSIDSYLPLWRQAVRSNPTLNIRSVYLANTSTESGSRRLQTQIGPERVRIGRARGADHCHVARADLAPALSRTPRR